MARLLIEQRHATSACVQIPENPQNQSAIAHCTTTLGWTAVMAILEVQKALRYWLPWIRPRGTTLDLVVAIYRL